MVPIMDEQAGEAGIALRYRKYTALARNAVGFEERETADENLKKVW